MLPRLLAVAWALAVGMFATASAQEPTYQMDPLAPARSGYLQCFTPDLEHKACRAIAEYRFLEDGNIDNEAHVLVQANPTIVMHAVAPVVVRNEFVCGNAVAGIDTATFDIDGLSASAEDTERLREAVGQVMASSLPGEVCSAYELDGGAFRADAFVDGVQRPELTDRVVWIAAGDGFIIRP